MTTHYWSQPNATVPTSSRPVAHFGAAALLQCGDGQLRLEGGTELDYRAAREWISLFFQEAVLVPSERYPFMPSREID